MLTKIYKRGVLSPSHGTILQLSDIEEGIVSYECLYNALSWYWMLLKQQEEQYNLQYVTKYENLR